MTPRVHEFETTREAYDASQTQDEISNGDVLVCTREYVVGILVDAWPVSITPKLHGEFHTLDPGVEWSAVPSVDGEEVRDYSDSLRAASESRAALGEPPIEYLAGCLLVTFRKRYGGRVLDDDYVHAQVYAQDGLIGIDMQSVNPTKSAQERAVIYREKLDLLVEWEIGEWQRIGPEDSEVFLTDEWRERLADQLKPLSNGRGWTEVEEEASAG